MWATNILRLFGIPVAAALLLCGCASGLSKEECQVADWRAIGYEDGVRGAPEARMSEHRKACAKHGVAFQLDAYRSGWEEGVQSYCQPGNGYRQGRSGKQYTGVCPARLEAAFLHAYRDGRQLHQLEADVGRIARSLSHKRNRLDDIEVEMRDTGIELVQDGLTTEQRVVLLDELRKLEEERQATKAQIPSLEAELAYRREQLATIAGQSDY